MKNQFNTKNVKIHDIDSAFSMWPGETSTEYVLLTDYKKLCASANKLKQKFDDFREKYWTEKRKPSIYLVSVLTGGVMQDANDYRVWGYYSNLETARKCVLENWSDISECRYYRYCLITEVGEGPLAIPMSQEWYEFTWANGELVSVNTIAQPQEYERIMFTF